MTLATQFPLHPKRRRVMSRNWAAPPEKRMIEHVSYRTSRYGGPPPATSMVTNMRKQQSFRKGA